MPVEIPESSLLEHGVPVPHAAEGDVQIGAGEAGELVAEMGEDVRAIEIYLLGAEGELVRF
jgi:hypothetical protein